MAKTALGEISPDALPVIPDKVTEKIEAGEDVSAEYIAGAAREQAAERARRQAGPVHLEDLTAVSRNDPRIAMSFDGASLPKAPQTRRVIPPPFRRPRIAIDHHGKSWQLCRADEIARGDIIPGIGAVAAAYPYIRRDTIAGTEGVAAGTDIRVTGAGGSVAVYDAAESVRVFRKQ